MKQRNPGIWPLVLILLGASLAVVALDPSVNPHRDAGAVRKANNGGDFLDASAVRVNLDVPSNASSVASLSAHNALMQAHGCTSVASAASLPNNASFTYDGLGGFATAGTNGIPANASFTLAGLSAKAFSDLTSIPTTIFGYGLTDAASTTLVTDHTGDPSDPHGANLTQTNASMSRLDVSGKACIFGNVGIGTSTPNVKIAAWEQTGDVFSRFANENGSLYVGDNADGSGEISVSSGSHPLLLKTGDIERMRILATGPVSLSAVPDYANNAAAIAGGLSVGNIYRNGDVLMIVH